MAGSSLAPREDKLKAMHMQGNMQGDLANFKDEDMACDGEKSLPAGSKSKREANEFTTWGIHYTRQRGARKRRDWVRRRDSYPRDVKGG